MAHSAFIGNRHCSPHRGDLDRLIELAFKENGWKVCQSSKVTKSTSVSQTLLQLGKCLLAPQWQAWWEFCKASPFYVSLESELL